MAGIVIIGYAGLAGSRILYAREPFHSALLGRYTARFLKGLAETPEEAGAGSAFLPEAERIRAFLSEEGVAEADFLEAVEGGVFAALWNLLKQHRTGAAFDQQRIPIRQQTVELCEQYALNPYRLSSSGCFVCLCDAGERLCMRAEAAGFAAAVIGYTEKGPAIRRVDGEETAYLRRPEPDSLYQITGGEKGGSSDDE